MTREEQLLAEIDAFMARDDVRIKESTFGRQALNDSKFVRRLRGGMSISVDRFERVRAFIRNYQPRRALAATPEEMFRGR